MKNKSITYEKYGILGFILVGLIGIIFVIISIIETQPPKPKQTAALTDAFNIIVLFVFGVILKTRKLNFAGDSDIKVFAESLNIIDKDFQKARFNIDRVNKVIKQFCDNIFWFIVFLILFYILNLFEDLNSDAFLAHFNSTFPFIKFFENISNAVSGAFIYLGFQVLYDRTLDEKNNPKTYYKGMIIFLLLFVVSYLFLLLTHLDKPDTQTTISNYYNLGCGIYNGWAMGLLFGRLISMEYYFKDIQLRSYKFSKPFFHYGAIYILPLYVLANTLFGVQEFVIYHLGNLKDLKPIMFAICFIGKAFFFLFVYHYINYKWLHIYLHLIYANNSIPAEIIRVINKRGID